MSPRTYAATVRRVLAELAADRRTVGLILVVPSLLVTLLHLVYLDQPGGEALFNRVAVTMMAVLPMGLMFAVTSVAMLRERASGTLERLWTTPLRRADLLLGYGTAFSLTVVGQSLVLCAVSAWCLGVEIASSWGWLVLMALVDGAVGVALGLLVSAFARTEFQAVQLMPVLIIPQLFLCGLLVPRSQLPGALEAVSDWLPMSWAVDAVVLLAGRQDPDSGFAWDMVRLCLTGLLLLVVAAMTFPRRSR